MATPVSRCNRSLVTLPALLAALFAGACTESSKTDQARQDPADDIAARTQQFTDDYAADESEASAASNQVQWLTGNSTSQDEDQAPMAIAANPRRPVETAQPPRPAAPPEPTPHQAPARPEPRRDPPPAPPRTLTQAELVAQLDQRLAASANDESLRPWLARAALGAIDPTQELTEADLGTLAPDQRRIVLAYQRTFSQIARGTGDGAEADRRAMIEAAHELADQVAGEQPLSIRNLKLCSKVNGFGVYDAFKGDTFLAGRNTPVIVYAELDHFRTETTDDRKHRVRLTQEIVLFNEADGLPVWRQRPATITDESHNIRRDFFVVQVIRLSDRLTVGKYLLKVTITDEVGRSVDEATLPIRLVADSQLAGQ